MNKDKKEIEEQEKKYKKEMALLYGAIAKDGKYQRTSNIAKLFKLSVRRIQQLTQEGILPTEETDEGRRYELCPTVQRYSEYLSSKAYGKSSTEKEIQLKQQKLEAEIELKELQGDFHKIKNDIEGWLKNMEFGSDVLKAIRRLKGSVKYLIVPTSIFEELGFTYLGPVDGHDLDGLLDVLQAAKKIDGPVMVHVLNLRRKIEETPSAPKIIRTVWGKGYQID